MRLLRLLKSDLHNEAREWVKDGLISDSQAEAICRRFGIDYHNRKEHSFGYYVLLALGYLFIGLAVIVLIGANWEEIPRAVRMGGLIGLTLLCNGIGLTAWRQNKPKAAVLWFFLGGLMYGASIMLIAQIYHLGEHFPDGILWWWLGILPVAFLLRSNLLMALTAVLAFLWFFVEAELNYYPALFPLFLLPLAWQVLRVNSSIILFLVLMGGVGVYIEYSLAWVIGDYRRFDFGPEHVFVSAAIFLVFHGLAKWLRENPSHHLVDYGVTLQLWTLRFAIIGLFIFSFDQPWRSLLGATWDSTGLVIAFSVIAISLTFGLTYLANRTLNQSASTLAFIVVYVAALMSALTLGAQHIIALQVADNLALVLTGIGLILTGIRRNVTLYFYLGVFTVLLTGLLRYVDLVGDYVGAALLFAVFAIVLLASARYWKNFVVKTEAAP